jgi:hypothetical protein
LSPYDPHLPDEEIPMYGNRTPFALRPNAANVPLEVYCNLFSSDIPSFEYGEKAAAELLVQKSAKFSINKAIINSRPKVFL